MIKYSGFRPTGTHVDAARTRSMRGGCLALKTRQWLLANKDQLCLRSQEVHPRLRPPHKVRETDPPASYTRNTKSLRSHSAWPELSAVGISKQSREITVALNCLKTYVLHCILRLLFKSYLTCGRSETPRMKLDFCCKSISQRTIPSIHQRRRKAVRFTWCHIYSTSIQSIVEAPTQLHQPLFQHDHSSRTLNSVGATTKSSINRNLHQNPPTGDDNTYSRRLHSHWSTTRGSSHRVLGTRTPLFLGNRHTGFTARVESDIIAAGGRKWYAPRSRIRRRSIGSRRTRLCRTDRLWLDPRSIAISWLCGVSSGPRASNEPTDPGIPFQNPANVCGWVGAASWLAPRRCRYCTGKALRSETPNRPITLSDNPLHRAKPVSSVDRPTISGIGKSAALCVLMALYLHDGRREQQLWSLLWKRGFRVGCGIRDNSNGVLSVFCDSLGAPRVDMSTLSGARFLEMPLQVG